MSREKDTEDGDRRGLVEEGTVCHPEKAAKSTKVSVEGQWVHQPTVKPSVSVQSVRPVTQTTGLPEVCTSNRQIKRLLFILMYKCHM